SSRHSPLKLISFRVNRVFCEICTPYVYQEMNLLEPVDNRTHHIARLYGRHVRAIRVFLGTRKSKKTGADSSDCPSDVPRSVDIYSFCLETQYIAFYHAHATMYSQFQAYKERSIAHMSFLLHLEKLDTIGVHFLQEKIDWMMDQVEFIARQVLTIASSDRASRIKRLELSIPTLKACAEDLRTKFTSLEHLSIHTSPIPYYLSNVSRPEALDWSAYSKLTTMSLSRSRHDSTNYTRKVPEMVRQIPSLQELFISDVAAINEEETVAVRPVGWSHLPDEWWNQRKPLRYLDIEAALNGTIYYLSAIPVDK
ncbi:10425_t:CDS:1, partial [Acaulospora colombiana]